MFRVVACPGKSGIVVNDICCGSSAVKSICRSLLEVCNVCVIAVPCHKGCLVPSVPSFPPTFFSEMSIGFILPVHKIHAEKYGPQLMPGSLLEGGKKELF